LIGRLWHRLAPPSPEQVIRAHAAQVHSDLRRIFGPRADLDDVSQSVFVEILRALPRFEGRSRLKTWVRRITWNVAYQEMRLAYRLKRWESHDEIEAVAPRRDDPETRAELGRLYDALERLAPKQRVVVLLHDVEGQSLKEIGEALGRPLQTVASQLRVGRKSLVEALGEKRRTSAGRAPGEKDGAR